MRLVEESLREPRAAVNRNAERGDVLKLVSGVRGYSGMLSRLTPQDHPDAAKRNDTVSPSSVRYGERGAGGTLGMRRGSSRPLSRLAIDWCSGRSKPGPGRDAEPRLAAVGSLGNRMRLWAATTKVKTWRIRVSRRDLGRARSWSFLNRTPRKLLHCSGLPEIESRVQVTQPPAAPQSILVA